MVGDVEVRKLTIVNGKITIFINGWGCFFFLLSSSNF